MWAENAEHLSGQAIFEAVSELTRIFEDAYVAWGRELEYLHNSFSTFLVRLDQCFTPFSKRSSITISSCSTCNTCLLFSSPFREACSPNFTDSSVQGEYKTASNQEVSGRWIFYPRRIFAPERIHPVNHQIRHQEKETKNHSLYEVTLLPTSITLSLVLAPSKQYSSRSLWPFV